MSIPLVNRQALGRAFTVPVQGRKESRPALGQMGPSIGGEEIAYREAVTMLEGVKKSFGKLLTMVGEGDAAEILNEAKQAVERTQAEYVKLLPRK